MVCTSCRSDTRTPCAASLRVRIAVCDWDAMERMWAAGFRALSVDSKSQPLLVSDNNIHVSTQSQREKHVEMLFESFDVPALYLARSAVLAAYVGEEGWRVDGGGRARGHAGVVGVAMAH